MPGTEAGPARTTGVDWGVDSGVDSGVVSVRVASAGAVSDVEVLGGGNTIAARWASTSTADPIRRRPKGTESVAAASPLPAIAAASAVVQAWMGEVNGSRAPARPPTRAKAPRETTPRARRRLASGPRAAPTASERATMPMSSAGLSYVPKVSIAAPVVEMRRQHPGWGPRTNVNWSRQVPGLNEPSLH